MPLLQRPMLWHLCRRLGGLLGGIVGMASSLGLHAGPSPDVVWRIEEPGFVLGTPSEGPDGTLYATAVRTPRSFDQPNGLLIAVGTHGAVQWRRTFTNQLSGPVAATSGRVYLAEQGTDVPGDSGRLWALTGPEGAAWVLPSGFPDVTAPSLSGDGTVVWGGFASQFLSRGAEIVAVPPEGTIRWRTTVPFGSLSSTLTVDSDGDVVFIAPAHGGVMRLNAQGGLRWTTPVPSFAVEGSAGLALGSDGAALVTAGWGGGLFKIGADGSILWRFASADETNVPPVLGPDGTIFVAGQTNRFYATRSDGTLRWAFEAPAPVRGAAAVAANGWVYFGDAAGGLHALDAEGIPQWAFAGDGAIVGSPLLTAGGNLCFATATGSLYLIRGDAGPAASPWPQFQQNGARHGSRPGPATPPAPPENLVAAPPTECAGFVRLTWDSAPGATSYELWRRLASDATEVPVLVTNLTGSRVFNDHSAAFEHDYTYWLRASNAAGTSPPSATVTARQSTKLWQLEVPGLRRPPAVSPDGSFAVVVTGAKASSTNDAVAFGSGGELRWRASLGGTAVNSPAIAADGTVHAVVGPNSSTLVALRPDGTPKWRLPLGFPVVGRIAIAESGIVYLAGTRIAAVSPLGTLLWQTNPVPSGSPTLGGVTLAPDGTLLVMSPSYLTAHAPNGRVRWTYNSRTPTPFGTSVDPAGNLYLAGDDGWIHGVSLTGDLRWKVRGTPVFTGQEPSVAADGTLIQVGSRVWALRPTGETLWESTNGFLTPFGSCLATDGTIYAAGNTPVGSKERAVIRGFTRTGSLACTIPLRSPLLGPPVLRDDGVLLVALDSGVVEALRASSGPENGPWPMTGHDARGTAHLPEPHVAPAPPVSVQANAFVGKVRIHWSPRPAMETNEVWRATQPDLSDAVLVGEAAPGQGFLDDMTAQSGTTYVYTVRARTRFGASPASPAVAGRVAAGVERLWSLTLSNTVSSMAIDARGMLFLASPGPGGFDGFLTAVGPTGDLRWRLRDQPGVFSGVCVEADGRVLHGLLRYDRDGRTAGRLGDPSDSASSEAAIDAQGDVFATVNQSELQAFSADGTRRWRRELPVNQSTSPSLTPDGHVVLYSNSNLVSWSGAGGTNWILPLGISRPNRIVVDASGGLVFQAGAGLIAVDPQGAVRWQVRSALPVPSAEPVVAPNGDLVAVTSTSSDPSDLTAAGYQAWLRRWTAAGESVWTVPLPRSSQRAYLVTLAANGTVFVASSEQLAAFGPDGGLLWQYDTQSTSLPSASLLGLDGRLHVVVGRTLHVLQTPGGPPGSWGMARGHPRGTASLHRPRPAALRLVRDGSELLLSPDGPLHDGITLLHGNTVEGWQIVGPSTPPSFPLRLLPTADREFFRLAIP